MKNLILILFLLQSCKLFTPSIGTEKNPLQFGIASFGLMAKEGMDFSDLEYFLQKEHELTVRFHLADTNEDLTYFSQNKKLHALMSTSQLFVKYRKQLDFSPRLITVRFGKTWYKSEVITHINSGIDKIEQLDGKSFVFTSHESASGYIIPSQLLAGKNINLKEKAFAQEHDLVVKLVYLQQYDAGATFYDDTNSQEVRDGRELIMDDYPDVLDKVKIIHISGQIPYDPILVKNKLDEEVYNKLSNGLRRYMRRMGEDSKFYQYFKISDLKTATIADFESYIKFVEDL